MAAAVANQALAAVAGLQAQNAELATIIAHQQNVQRQHQRHRGIDEFARTVHDNASNGGHIRCSQIQDLFELNGKISVSNTKALATLLTATSVAECLEAVPDIMDALAISTTCNQGFQLQNKALAAHPGLDKRADTATTFMVDFKDAAAKHTRVPIDAAKASLKLHIASLAEPAPVAAPPAAPDAPPAPPPPPAPPRATPEVTQALFRTAILACVEIPPHDVVKLSKITKDVLEKYPKPGSTQQGGSGGTGGSSRGGGSNTNQGGGSSHGGGSNHNKRSSDSYDRRDSYKRR